MPTNKLQILNSFVRVGVPGEISIFVTIAASIFSRSTKSKELRHRNFFRNPNYDGKDYPVTGIPDWDTIARKRINAYKMEITHKKAGKVVSTATSVVSKDG